MTLRKPQAINERSAAELERCNATSDFSAENRQPAHAELRHAGIFLILEARPQPSTDAG